MTVKRVLLTFNQSIFPRLILVRTDLWRSTGNLGRFTKHDFTDNMPFLSTNQQTVSKHFSGETTTHMNDDKQENLTQFHHLMSKLSAPDKCQKTTCKSYRFYLLIAFNNTMLCHTLTTPWWLTCLEWLEYEWLHSLEERHFQTHHCHKHSPPTEALKHFMKLFHEDRNTMFSTAGVCALQNNLEDFNIEVLSVKDEWTTFRNITYETWHTLLAKNEQMHQDRLDETRP